MRLDLSNEFVFGKGIPPRILEALSEKQRDQPMTWQLQKWKRSCCNELVCGRGIPPKILEALSKGPAHDLGVAEEEEKLLHCLQLPAM